MSGYVARSSEDACEDRDANNAETEGDTDDRTEQAAEDGCDGGLDGCITEQHSLYRQPRVKEVTAARLR